MKGMTNAQKDVSDLATKDELAQKADQSALDSTNTEVAKKANQSDLTALQTTVTGKQDKLTAGTNINISTDNTISASGGSVTAGEGISVSGSQVSLKSVHSGYNSVGGTTYAPQFNVDKYGRVTSVSETRVYPPTTAGEAGQVWMSRGSGQGYWGTVEASPAISEVKVASITRYYRTNSSPQLGINTSVTWNVNTNALGSRSGTLVVTGSLVYLGDTESITFKKALTNDILKQGYYSGSMGPGGGVSYDVTSFSASATIVLS